MRCKYNIKSKLLTLFLVVVLMIPVLVACGGDKDDDTATPVVTTTPASGSNIPDVTPLSTSDKPVKIGLITSWSGASAMIGSYLADPSIKLIEWQVKQQGGILGGREVKVVTYDDRSSVADSIAGANKLLYDENVSSLSWAATGGAAAAVSSFAEENHILYVSVATLRDSTPEKPLKYSITVALTTEARERIQTDLIINELKAKKVGLLGTADADSRDRIAFGKNLLKAAGVEIVYEDYVDQGTINFTSQLTKIKRANPDVLMVESFEQEAYVNIAKQIMELGGWGNIKFLGIEPAIAAASFPGADGWYSISIWYPGSTYPASSKFEQDYNQVLGKMPTANHVYPYLVLWTPIHAIELAGTDEREAVAKAANSGNLEWDTPIGVAKWAGENTNYSTLQPCIVQIQGGKVVPLNVSGEATPTAAPTTPGTGGGTGLDINSTIGELVANEQTAAVLEKCVPGLTTNPKLMGAYGMTLKDVAPLKPDMFTAEVMMCLEESLAAIK